MLASEAKGHRFESCRARQIIKGLREARPLGRLSCDASVTDLCQAPSSFQNCKRSAGSKFLIGHRLAVLGDRCPSSISVRRETAGLFSCSRAWPATHSTARPKRASVCASVPKWRRISLTMLALLNLATLLLRCAMAFFRSHNEQAIVELTLRQQLATYTLTGSKPNITPLDRALWVALSRFWPRWKDTLVIVKPDTVIRWHRKGFRLYWRAISKRGPGRPADLRGAAGAHSSVGRRERLGARKIQAELGKLGITASLATVSRYLPKRAPDRGKQQR